MNEADAQSDKPSKKRKSWRLRFSLRTVLVLMTLSIVAVVFYQRRARAIEALREVTDLGATVNYHPDSMPFLTDSMCEFLRNVSRIKFPENPIFDDDLSSLKDLPYLQSLSLENSVIGKEGFDHISKCRNLRKLFISGCGRFDDRCAESIKQLTLLDTLDVSNTNLTSTGAEQLASGESLRNFTFSCTGRRQSTLLPKPSWYSAEKLKAICGHRDLHVTMVGEAYLENIDEQTIAVLKKMDTLRLREFHVRNSDLSSNEISAITGMGVDFRRVRFRNCPLQPDDLKEFNVRSTSLVLERTTLKVTDVINLFGSHFLTAKLGSSGTEFILHGSPYTVSIDELADELEVGFFSKMPNLNHVDCFCRDNLSFLKAVEHSQPSISIYAHLDARDANATFWDTIKATPSLIGLSVNEPPKEICPQFTTEHQLKSLQLFNVPDDPAVLNEKFFQEVAKLKLLQSITIRNRLQVGQEISPLTTLENLNHVDVGNLDDDAARILLGMNPGYLSVSWDLLSPAMIKKIRARH